MIYCMLSHFYVINAQILSFWLVLGVIVNCVLGVIVNCAYVIQETINIFYQKSTKISIFCAMVIIQRITMFDQLNIFYCHPYGNSFFFLILADLISISCFNNSYFQIIQTIIILSTLPKTPLNSRNLTSDTNLYNYGGFLCFRLWRNRLGYSDNRI